jgi:acylphosphatase
MQKRRRVLFFGRVQGVGFRVTTRSIAEQFAVTGWVRNQPDGSVELVAEGTVAELDRFLAAIDERMDRCITSQEIYDSEARGEFLNFCIQS